MSLKILTSAATLVFLTAAPTFSAVPQKVDEGRMDELFRGYEATFMVTDLSDNKTFAYHENLLDQKAAPCSTFKITNSLIALDCGAIKKDDSKMKWDGTKHSIDSWNQDQDLQSAVKNSCVWYFQKVAKLIGRERMQNYLKKLHYGNEDCSGELTTFWLSDDNSLTITARQQVEFLTKLFENKLPVSPKAMAETRELIKLKDVNGSTLFGKTGTYTGSVTGWFVGAVVHGKKTFVFATKMSAKENASGPQTRKITEVLLTELGLL